MSVSPIDTLFNPDVTMVGSERGEGWVQIDGVETLDPMPPISPLIDTGSFDYSWNNDYMLGHVDREVAAHSDMVTSNSKPMFDVVHNLEGNPRLSTSLHSQDFVIYDAILQLATHKTCSERIIEGASNPPSPPITPSSSPPSSLPSPEWPGGIHRKGKKDTGRTSTRELSIVGQRTLAISKSISMTSIAVKTIKGTQACGRDCSMRFETLGTLAEHLDTYHPSDFRPHKCTVENCIWSVVGFHKVTDCTRHMDTVHAEAKFHCFVCSKMFKRADAVKRHMVRVHERKK